MPVQSYGVGWLDIRLVLPDYIVVGFVSSAIDVSQSSDNTELAWHMHHSVNFFMGVGVEYVGVEGEDKNQLVVVGDGVDPANLTSCLRKKMGNAELLKVEVVSAGTKPAAKEEATTTVITPYPQQLCPYPSYYSRPPVVVYPYPDGHCYESHTDSSCTIL